MKPPWRRWPPPGWPADYSTWTPAQWGEHFTRAERNLRRWRWAQYGVLIVAALGLALRFFDTGGWVWPLVAAVFVYLGDEGSGKAYGDGYRQGTYDSLMALGEGGGPEAIAAAALHRMSTVTPPARYRHPWRHGRRGG